MFRATKMATAIRQSGRLYSTATSAAPRHLMSINDLTPAEFTKLVRNGATSKAEVAKVGRLRGQDGSLGGALAGQTVAMMFSKRSTRTRVSTEGAIALMQGHPMFLGKDDIQLGVSIGSHEPARPSLQRQL